MTSPFDHSKLIMLLKIEIDVMSFYFCLVQSHFDIGYF